MKMKNTKNVLAKISTLATASAIAIAICGCEKKVAQVQETPPPEVFVAKPLKKTIESWDEYVARLGAYESVELRSRVNGYLDKILFNDGQLVKKGDLLFVIDPRQYNAALAAAKAAVKEVEARVALAKSNLARAKDLLKANAMSKEAYDTREAELLSSEAALLNAKAKLEEAKLNVEFTQIRAPISGRVSEGFVDVGNLVNANQTILTTIVNSDIVQASYEISEQDIIRYRKNGVFEEIKISERKGPPVELRLLGEDTAVRKGVLNYVDNSMGSQTSSLTLRADIDNADHSLAVGMFGKVKMRSGKPKECIIVPEEIIGTDLINRYVIVINKDNVAEYRPVKIGRLDGKYRIIESGLSEDDNVVVVGLQRAIPGVKVSPKLQKMDEKK